MMTLLKRLLILFFVFAVFSCFREKVLFVYEDYYPFLFDSADDWQDEVTEILSKYKLKPVFQNVKFNDSFELSKFFNESTEKLVITVPSFSEFTGNLLRSSGKIILDLNPLTKQQLKNHFTLPGDRIEIYAQAGKAAAEGSFTGNVYAFFYTGNNRRILEKEAFVNTFSLHSDKEIIIIEINDILKKPVIPAEAYVEGSDNLVFFSCGQQNPQLVNSLPAEIAVAGEGIIQFKEFYPSFLFSIEYLPEIHLEGLLKKYKGIEGSGMYYGLVF